MTDSARVHRSYYEQDGCWNCQWSLRVYECDYQDDLYCRRGAPPRPLCGSFVLNEAFSYVSRAIEKERNLEWREWADGREVSPCGMCEHWKAE